MLSTFAPDQLLVAVLKIHVHEEAVKGRLLRVQRAAGWHCHVPWLNPQHTCTPLNQLAHHEAACAQTTKDVGGVDSTGHT
jgi:hypothetical protein